MKQFDQWLRSNPGMASKLADALHVSRSHVSQVRAGSRPIPIDWMPTIEALSSGLLTIDGMVHSQARPRIAARRRRKEAV